MTSSTGTPLVGRERECTLLDGALAQAKGAQGSTWILSGPAGIGKTRALRWLEQRGREHAFEVHWGYCLKEANNAFFPFYQIFRPGESRAPTLAVPTEESGGPTVMLFEEDRSTRLIESLQALPPKHPALLVSRERESTIRQRYPGLPHQTLTLWLTRAEGPGAINPTSLDSLAESIGRYYESFPGAVVGVTGLEYLISQNQFLPVLKLIQFLRDAAEGSGGRLLITFNPVTMEAREVALLEGEGDIAWSGKSKEAEKTQASEAPAMVMLRYLRSLEGWGRGGPQVILLDDLQWADPQSLQAFQFLARNIRSLPVLLVATLLDGEGAGPTDAGEAPLEEIMDSMRREGTLTSLALSRLDAPALAELCTSLLGEPPLLGPGEGSLTPLLERSGGSPYFLMEILRQLREDGQLTSRDGRMLLNTTEEGGKSGPARLPETLKRLVLRRLRSLTPEERELLETAAIAGSEFDVATLTEALGKPLSEVSQTLDGLVRPHGLLERHGKVLGRWHFTHPLIWEGLLAEVAPERVRSIAAKLASWTAEHRPEDVETVARLYYLAMDSVEGPAWVKRALEGAIRGHAAETSERYHHWFQELMRAGGIPENERVRAGLDTALELYATLGRSISVDRILDSLMTLQASPGTRATIEAYRAFILSVENAAEARRRFRALRDSFPAEVGPLPPIVRALESAMEGNARYAEGNLRGALEAYRAATTIEDPGIPPWFTDRSYYDAGWTASELDEREVYEEMFSKGMALAEKIGGERLRAYFLALQAMSLVNTGDLLRAEQVEITYRDILRRIGNVSAAAIASWDLTSLYILMGKYGRARQIIDEGRALARGFGMKLEEDLFLVPEARIELGEGRIGEGVRRMEEAIQTIHANAATGPIAIYHIYLAHALLDLGDTERAANALGQIQNPKTELKPHEIPAYHRAFAELTRARGEREESWNQADMALAQARKLRDRVEEAYALETISRWEATFGSPATAKQILAEAEEIYASTGAAPLHPPSPEAHVE